jgi:pimeloyl-ACP methyl ester carboxylesterase
VNIYWDEAGEGEPVLLIMGLGSSRAVWHRIRPALATQYRTIAFDNRGVGESDVPAGPYSMREMAADAVAVMGAAKIASAHVLGLSMGGMIAQELALQYPDRVRSLILACTSPGGKNAVQADPDVLSVVTSFTSTSPEAGTEAFVPLLHAAGTARTRIDEDLALRRKWYPSADGYRGQLQAIRGWEAFSRLHQIRVPTLVIHGDCDRLIPTRNGEILAERIPGAKLVLLPQAGHVFLTDQPERSQTEIIGFLSQHAQRISPLREVKDSTITRA